MRQKKDEKLDFKNWVFNELSNQLIIFLLNLKEKFGCCVANLKFSKKYKKKSRSRRTNNRL